MDLRTKMLQVNHLSSQGGNNNSSNRNGNNNINNDNNNGRDNSSSPIIMMAKLDKLVGSRSSKITTGWHYSIDELSMATRDISTKQTNVSKQTPQASKHLLELQKEIKEEEDEIFADINSLINSRSNLFSTVGDTDDDDNDDAAAAAVAASAAADEDRLQFDTNKNEQQKHSSTSDQQHQSSTFDHHQIHNHLHHHSNHQLTNNNIHLNNYNSSKDADEHHLAFATDCDDLNDYHGHCVEEINHATNTASITTNRDYSSESSYSGGGGGSLSSSSNNGVGVSRACGPCNDDCFQSVNETTATSTSTNATTNKNQSALDLMHQDDESQYLSELLEDDFLEPAANLENDPNYAIDDEHTFNDQSCDGQNDQQNYQDLQAVIQQVTNNLPKPCVFFLEGNCRRSDCKYSHDLSNITCKYWIEGFCFKGEMCPFLHSYTPPGESNDSCLDEDGIKSLSKTQLNPTFVIESEADFPSLPLDAPTTALNDSTRSSNNADAIATNIKNQILSSNPSVVFKTVKKKRKRG